MNYSEYRKEIEGIAEDLVDEAMDLSDGDVESVEEIINDRLLHEAIDGHQWVIYYSYNDDVIDNSDNAEAYQDIYDDTSIGQIVTDSGLDGLKSIIAYWAMYTDVQDVLPDHLEIS